MKSTKMERVLAIVLTLTMMLSMMVVFAVSGSAADNVYTLDAGTLHPFAAGAKDDGDYEKTGKDNYFTVIYSEKTKVETNEKSFSDGVSASQRIAWGAKSEVGSKILNVVKIKTAGSANVKIWWAGGDSGRAPAIFDESGNVVTKFEGSTVKNELYVTELSIPAQGVYYIGNTGGSNYFYRIEVTDNQDGTPAGERADWAGVSAPVISSAADNGSGKIQVDVSALVGHNGADEVLVHMYQGDKLIATKGSIIEQQNHTLFFAPENSGNYSFIAEILRTGEENKRGAAISADFSYVLGNPNLASVTSIGGGSVELQWSLVHEAESYNIYVSGVKVGTASASDEKYTVTGLTIGQEYSFEVSAVRGNEEKRSNVISAVVAAEAQRTWAFTVYGPSTNSADNGYLGSVNDDGWVTVYSENGKGKIQPTSVDGLAFYYTAVPTEYNFTLRAKVTVDSWTLSNGQEGFGLLVTDRLVDADDKYGYWNNSYIAGSTKIEYKYDSDNDEIIDIKVVNPAFKKFSMKCGIGTVARTGITPENIQAFANQETAVINEYFVSRNYTLERQAADVCSESGTYNVIGNFTTTPAGTLSEEFLITEYIMEIQKNNSGYFITYYAEDGTILGQQKFYDPEALNHLDSEYVYAGFFASRNARVTYSDIEFSTILASEDAERVYPDTTYITPTVTVNSGSVTTKSDYELIIDANVAGNLTVKYLGKTIVDAEKIDMGERFRTNIELLNYDENDLKIEFTPDPDQWIADFTELSSTKTVYVNHIVMFNRGNYHRKTIYISPSVKAYTTTADGTKENPFDIFTALENAYPGQTLILMEGTYKLNEALKIQRGMDGTEDAPIRLIADPEATSRPVLDFQGLYSGFTHAGDYWYFYGFDVTRSADMQKGFQISGNYNVVDSVNTYYNGNTGLQICRLSGSDLWEDWPCYNLILNCTSYCNFDSGFEDADGFAAKLTVGDGNVFDGCIAYNNADDGWDLYAKVETGSIGAITIRNCIAYNNGWVPEYTKTGNGNGFKLGGSSLSGKHVLENSIAFNNLAKGIDCNSCPDIIVNNCVSFNNGSYNVALYTNNVAPNTAFVANGIVSFRTEGLDIREELKGKGSQVAADYVNNTTYYWDEANGWCANLAGDKITADMFVSLEFTGWTRNADGTIDLHGFLEIKENAPAAAQSCKLGGTASYEITLLEDEECSFGKAWYTLNKDAHWHYCECGNKSQVAAHDFIWIIDYPAEGNQTGKKHEECTECGYKRAAITIYPENKPSTPVEPEQPNEPELPEDPVEQPMSFFEMIWKAILDFLRSIFPGLFPAEPEQAAVHKSFIS